VIDYDLFLLLDIFIYPDPILCWIVVDSTFVVFISVVALIYFLYYFVTKYEEHSSFVLTPIQSSFPNKSVMGVTHIRMFSSSVFTYGIITHIPIYVIIGCLTFCYDARLPGVDNYHRAKISLPLVTTTIHASPTHDEFS
jgi:hypothetical protein